MFDSFDDDVIERNYGGVRVVVGSDMISYITEMLSEHNINSLAVVYFDDISSIAREIARELSADWRVFELSLPSAENFEEKQKLLKIIPDYARFIVAIGTGEVAELCQHFAKDKGYDYAIVATAPSTDCFLRFEKSPKFIVAEKEHLNNCPERLKIAGQSILLAQPLKDFEYETEMLLCGKRDKKNQDFSMQSAKSGNSSLVLDDMILQMDSVSLFFALLNLSQKYRKGFNPPSEVFADILCKSEKSRYFGEYIFIASYTLAAFYQKFLSLPCSSECGSYDDIIDVMLPPDKIKTLKLLEKKCDFNSYTILKRIDIIDTNSYFRIKYILNEYRAELLAKLNQLDFSTKQKLWKRQYSDAGFWVQHLFSSRELLLLMSLSGALSGGLLGFAKASGALDTMFS